MNISAQKRGIDFMLESKNGLAFIDQTLKKIVTFPMPAGSLLKRMCLIFLYNFSICKRGATLLQQSECGVENILSCLDLKNTPEIHQLALNLMISLIDDSSIEFRDKINQMVC